MKMKALFLAVALVGVSLSASATPLYVGTNLTPQNNISFGFGYTPTKKAYGVTGKTGTITNYALKSDYNVIENLALGLDLPFYWADKNANITATATTAKAKFGLGNMGINANWNQRLNETSDDMAWGYSVALAAYFPTAVKDETVAVQTSNVALDLHRYGRKWSSIIPTAGLFIENEMFMAKINTGVGYSYIGKKNRGPGDQSRFNVPSQLGLSYKVMPNFAVNAEYNTMFLDKTTKAEMAIGTKQARLRQVATPSLSGNFEGIMGQAYVNLPVDSTSRKANALAAGVNLGYMF